MVMAPMKRSALDTSPTAFSQEHSSLSALSNFCVSERSGSTLTSAPVLVPTATVQMGGPSGASIGTESAPYHGRDVWDGKGMDAAETPLQAMASQARLQDELQPSGGHDELVEELNFGDIEWGDLQEQLAVGE